jgi:hypothetical protein
MFDLTKYLRSALVLSAITAISLGLIGGPVYAQKDDDEKEKEASSREVLVECDKGQSVQQILRQFANDTKPLEIVIKGTCVNDDEIQIERNKVDIVGDEEIGGTIPFMLVDGGRQIGIGGNLILADGLAISAGTAEIETESSVTVNGPIFLGSQSLLRITTEASEDDEESLNGSSAGQVDIAGRVTIDNQSLLEVQREVNDGAVTFYDEIILSLQSSLYMRDATAGNIVLNNDSHALLGDNAGGNSIACDSESRVWGNTTGFVVLNDPLFGMPCKGD